MKIHLVLLACCFTMTTFGQLVILGTLPKTVPQGKKWILPTNQEILIEISGGALRSGTLCNARILSIPKIVMGIIEGEYGNPNEVYSILFNELNSIAYANKYTYSIIPKSIVNSRFNLSELQNKDIDDIGSRQIVFFPGQKVYVGECLQSIQLIETNLTTKDLADISKKEDDLKLWEQKSKKVNEDIKIKAEQERRSKILNSPDEYLQYDLTNFDELVLSVQTQALDILFEYICEFDSQYLLQYETKLSESEKSIYYSTQGKYHKYQFLLYVDKTGELKKISLDMISIKGEGQKEFELNQSWFERLKPYISINKPAVIRLDDKDYFVNYKYFILFNVHKSSSKCTIQISVNKKKEITIFNNQSELTNEKALDVIKSSNKIVSIEKGIYSVFIVAENIDFECGHFRTRTENKIFTSKKDSYNVTSIIKDY